MKKLLLALVFICLPLSLFAENMMDELEGDLDVKPTEKTIDKLESDLDMKHTEKKVIDLNSAVGEWYTFDEDTGKKNSIITIYQQGDLFYGKITKSIGDNNNGPKTCVDCPGDLNGKPTIGLRFMWDFKFAGNGKYTGGRIVDPDDGSVYQANMQLADGGKKLKLRGYVGISLFGRTETWERVM